MIITATMGPHTTPSNSVDARSRDLDVIKGCLVVMMVIYHSASSSRDVHVNLSVTYAIPFVHGAFLTITGFLCGYHYWPMILGNRSTVARRLLARAARLALTFVACNALLCVAGVTLSPSRLAGILADLRAVTTHCILGISNDYFAFEVLMYIAEFLCVAAIVARYTRAAHFILASVILLALAVGGNTLLFLAYGAVGMEVGIAAAGGRLQGYDRRLRDARAVLLLVLAADIVIRSRYEPLLSNGVKLPLRSVETMLWFYAFLGFPGQWRWCAGPLVFLGRYTLFAYLFQMLVLRILVSVGSLGGMSGWSTYFVYVIVVTLATYAAVLLLDQLRRRHGIDAFYRLAFG